MSHAPRLLLLKSHVSSYTRKDGTFVAEHDDSRMPSGETKKDRIRRYEKLADDVTSKLHESGFHIRDRQGWSSDIGHSIYLTVGHKDHPNLSFPQVRVSDHSVGVIRHSEHIHVRDGSDVQHVVDEHNRMLDEYNRKKLDVANRLENDIKRYGFSSNGQQNVAILTGIAKERMGESAWNDLSKLNQKAKRKTLAREFGLGDDFSLKTMAKSLLILPRWIAL